MDRLARVDLPEPVPPMMPVTFPASAKKETLRSAGSSAPLYLKLTSLNSIVPFASGDTGLDGSEMDGCMSSTSFILPAETCERGIKIKSMEIIIMEKRMRETY